MLQNFVASILPANYWLSKSMEFTKRNSCGTLWYLKKWFVFYNFIFLKEELFEKDYVAIIKLFNQFIESLPADTRDEARNYFFEIDLRQANFLKLATFMATEQTFATPNDKKAYENNAKKFYFMYVMNLGGQSGYKEQMKNLMAAGVNYEKIVAEIKATMIANKEANPERKLKEQLSDFPAAIRNERQLFFYYGFFQGRETADLSGFYNLTNIGKAVVGANFYVLLAIWEHQKLKMISQSPLADMQNLPDKNSFPLPYEKFAIHSHPYFALLTVLENRKTIDLDTYQYVIAKTSNETNLLALCNELNPQMIAECKQKAHSLNRRAETETEDFTKELKKFILGLCEMPKDFRTNPLCALSWLENKQVQVRF